MSNNDYDTGISSEVFTVKSNVRLIDIFNLILEKKANAALSLFNSLNDDGTIERNVSTKYSSDIGVYLIRLSNNITNGMNDKTIKKELLGKS